MAALKAPPDIQQNEELLPIWKELCKSANYTAEQTHMVRLLVVWTAISRQCMADMIDANGIHIAYSPNGDEIKALPQAATLKQASQEIRAITEALKQNNGAVKDVKPPKTPLMLIQRSRDNKAKKAKGA